VVEGARLESVLLVSRVPATLLARTRSPTAAVHIRPILPRSRHLPVAVTDGRSTRNLNKIGVRLWT
jgi:hypothetical protein